MNQMNPLIATTNFSASSANAAKYAANMALAIHVDLYILHVMSLPGSVVEVPLTEEFFNEMRQEDERELEKLKLEVQKQTEGRLNIYIAFKIGSFENELEEYCKLKNPFAVVMGTKKSSSERFLFESNTIYAIQHLHYPLLVIPEGSTFHIISKIVIACDIADASENIPINYLKELQRVFHASFYVLNVGPKMTEDMKSNNEFASLKDLLRDLDPTFYFKIADTVEHGINKFLEENGADLLLLLPQRHDFFEFHKSHMKKILLNTDVPVVSIHE